MVLDPNLQQISYRRQSGKPLLRLSKLTLLPLSKPPLFSKGTTTIAAPLRLS
jgi:hypothetical protein